MLAQKLVNHVLETSLLGAGPRIKDSLLFASYMAQRFALVASVTLRLVYLDATITQNIKH